MTTDPLRAKVLQDRVQKVQRYSFQRPFIEVYRLTPSFDRWRVSAELRDMVELTVVSPKRLLPRRVPYPHFEVRHPVRQVAQGRIERGEPAAPVWKDRSLVKIGPELKGYPEQELEIVPSLELQEYTSTQTAVLDRPYRANEKIALGAGEYQILDMGVNLTGMPGSQDDVCHSLPNMDGFR